MSVPMHMLDRVKSLGWLPKGASNKSKESVRSSSLAVPVCDRV